MPTDIDYLTERDEIDAPLVPHIVTDDDRRGERIERDLRHLREELSFLRDQNRRLAEQLERLTGTENHRSETTSTETTR